MRQDLDNLKRDIERQLQDGAYVVGNEAGVLTAAG